MFYGAATTRTTSVCRLTNYPYCSPRAKADQVLVRSDFKDHLD